MAGHLLAFALLLSCASAAVELQRHKPHSGRGGQCPPCPQGSQGTPPPPGGFNFYFLVRCTCSHSQNICRALCQGPSQIPHPVIDEHC